MQAPPPPARRRSPWLRYAPFIAIAVVIVVVAVFLGGKGSSNKSPKVSTGDTTGAGTSGLPTTYAQAKAAGTLDKYTWSSHCDTSTGNIAIPVLAAAPCVPSFTGDNGGATAPGVSAATINVVFYVGKPDPQFDTLAKKLGVYDTPDAQIQGMKDYVKLYNSLYESYGRKINLEILHGSGNSSDATAARADAIRAAEEMHTFAVLGGPSQTNAFADELTNRGVMCIGACLIAQPESFYDSHPGLFGIGPTAVQPTIDTVEFISKQLKGKDAIYAGDPAFQQEPRKFAFLGYDTVDGQFKPIWDQFAKQMADAGTPFVKRVSYFLDLTRAQEDARTIITSLKSSGATSVVFSGDPILPIYFTQEATKQNYHPEWIISGTVYADTDVFARGFDQSQWAHAFGIGLVGLQSPKTQHDDYQVHQWYFGTPPPNANTSGIVNGDVNLFLTGVQLAGPDLTRDNFAKGIRSRPLPPESADGLRPIISYGDHGLWPTTDYGGLDNVNLIWWDPNAKGQDETGTEGTGMYRYVDNGRRFLPGKWPTDPVKLFDPANTITNFTTRPDSLKPKQYPKPAQ